MPKVGNRSFPYTAKGKAAAKAAKKKGGYATGGSVKASSSAKGKKEDIKKRKEIGKKTIKLALDFVPFAGAVSSSIELLGSLMTVKDEDRPKGFLGNFDLDDYTSKIIDNKIEGEFLKHILKVIEDKNENDLVKDFDMTTEFNKFLLDKYERKVVGNK